LIRTWLGVDERRVAVRSGGLIFCMRGQTAELQTGKFIRLRYKIREQLTAVPDFPVLLDLAGWGFRVVLRRIGWENGVVLAGGRKTREKTAFAKGGFALTFCEEGVREERRTGCLAKWW
jgi:hypothetical protein